MSLKESLGILSRNLKIATHDYERYTIPTIAVLTIIRIILPGFLIYRPVIAMLISYFIDEVDGILLNLLSTWDRTQYQLWDKVLDMWWYVALLIYAIKRFGKAKRNWLIFFFVYRLAGQALYIFVPYEEIFLFFPNYFEALFMVWLLEERWPWFTRVMKTRWKYLIYLLAFGIAMLREAEIHVGSATYQEW